MSDSDSIMKEIRRRISIESRNALDVDLLDLVREAAIAIVATCLETNADERTTNWLSKAKEIGAYDGPTEGPIEAMLEWLMRDAFKGVEK